MMIKPLSFGLLAIAVPAIAVPVTAVEPVTEAPLPDLEATTTAADLLAQDETAVAVITNVQIESTPDGLTVTLVSDQPLSAAASQVVGDALITDIPDAILDLQDSAVAEQFSPAEGIALVQVSSTPEGTVQIAITGTDGPPEVQVSTQAGNLVLSVVPGVATAAEAAESEAIQVVVTATRTEENVLDVPRSVTVIDREQLQQQRELTNNLPDILGELVPGLGPPTLQNSTRTLSLRGRTALILIDGVPQNPNSGFNTELNTIDPDVIERIEVVRGPSAIYGDGATGGIINIITRAATEEDFVVDLSARTNVGLTSVEEDSFGYGGQIGFAGNDGRTDLRASLSYDVTNAFFDAEGDRIPPSGVADTERLGFLAKFGHNLDDQQRLGLTYSLYFEDLDNTEFISDPAIIQIPGLQKARAIEVGDVEYEDDPQQTNHVINLTYRHENILNSQLDAQFFYRDTQLRQGFSDLRGRDLPDFFPLLWQTALDSEEWGGRLQLDTSFSENFSLLWGADYGQEENDRLVLVSDIATFDATRTLDVVEVLNQTPTYDLESLGLFAQATWDISDQWQISGGLRYDRFDFNVEDSILAFNSPQERAGGSGDADDVSFNVGLIYKPIPEVGLFASFAQGFSIPDIGLTTAFVVPADADISDDLLLEPQQVDNFEIGVRGEFDQVQASLSAFYNESDLGTNLRVGDDGLTEVARAPQRNYGVEATVDWQPSNTWRLGGYFSWNEGESDDDDDGEFLALSSVQVQPYKVGLYLENDTTPGWTNRLQLLGVGSRDRAFDDDVDGFSVDGYVTVDLLSTVQIGDGRLTVGIRNLLNNQYLPVSSQERIAGTEDRRFAAPGITLNLGYSIEF
ncbi:MAG: TonB-dependent receptor [Cyanobacteria bacterium P01_H01_bin.153]